METPYRAVTFVKHEIISRDKLDQIESNLQWINDNTPRGILYAPKPDITAQSNLLVVIGGKSAINVSKKSSTARAAVKFGAAFDPSCLPNVTTGLCSDYQRTLFCVVNGPGSSAVPTSTGFDISVAVQDDPTTKKTEVLKKDFWVHWIAMGYRRDDMNEF